MINDDLKSALEAWDKVYGFKEIFIDRNDDPDGGEPLCGYSDWDEYLTDIDADLAQAGELLADAIRRALG